MKTNKVTKLGISLLSVAALGVVAPALIDVPVFGVSIVKADENQEPPNFRITYRDIDSGEEISAKMIGVLYPGQSVNIYKEISGYQIVSNYEWMPNYNASYDVVSMYFYGANGYNDMYLNYRKLEPTPTPTPEPEVKPAPKPSDTPKPEVKPETKPSDTPKPEVKPAPKPSDTPKPEVKPEPAPKGEEKQEPLKYRISYYDEETGEEIAAKKTGVINPGETINVYKDIDGYEVTSKSSRLPNYEATYDIVARNFHGDPDGYKGFHLDYKKLDADAKPSDTPKPEVKPEPKPSDTSKPEVKPAPKPSDTSKPEVKPEPKPSETPKPEVKPETKPSEIPNPEVKPETKPSDTPKPEVKPEPKPSDTSKPEVKPETKPSDTSKPEVKPELKPQTNSNTAPTAPVKPVGQTSNSKADKPTSKKETPALPNTGEQSSSLSLVGLLLASLGLAGLTYKGRH